LGLTKTLKQISELALGETEQEGKEYCTDSHVSDSDEGSSEILKKFDTK